MKELFIHRKWQILTSKKQSPTKNPLYKGETIRMIQVDEVSWNRSVFFLCTNLYIFILMISNEDQTKSNSPFKIVHNYRSTSTRSSRMSKKRQIRKASEQRIQIPIKKHRKMTEQLEMQNKILEEESPYIGVRGAHSEAEVEEKLSLQNCELWGISDLEKGIPVDFQESQLDFESPLDINSKRSKIIDPQNELDDLPEQL